MKTTVVKSDRPRQLSPAVDDNDVVTLVENNTAFAFKLYHAVPLKNNNLFMSPFSISEVLAMTYAGARSRTEKEISQTLNFTLRQDILHPAFDSLDLRLRQPEDNIESSFKINIVNAIWGQKGLDFLRAFLNNLADNYGSELMLLDFINEMEQSRTAINNWISEQTQGKIKDLVPKGAINHLTRLLLTNAIYFKASWKYTFNKNATHDGVFHTFDITEISIPMMKQVKLLPYVEGDLYQAVELPYKGNKFSMIILLPGQGKFQTFENSMDKSLVDSIINQLRVRSIDLTLPKFKYETTFNMKDILGKMGMESAFSREADFSGLTGNKELYLQDVLHKAFISVDESGTEAAAASAVIVSLKSAMIPVKNIEFKIDRPFIFIIRDIQTQSILFLGRVVNPAVSTR